jgi:hypothetical protein
VDGEVDDFFIAAEMRLRRPETETIRFSGSGSADHESAAMLRERLGCSERPNHEAVMSDPSQNPSRLTGRAAGRGADSCAAAGRQSCPPGDACDASESRKPAYKADLKEISVRALKVVYNRAPKAHMSDAG